MNIDWKNFEELIDQVVSRYEYRNIERIVGISRGGNIPATVLSHRLNVPLTILVWSTRDTEEYDTEKILSLVNTDLSTTLFVDDICDSGETIRQIKKYIPESRWVTLVSKQHELVEYSPILTKSKDWVIFPWE